MRPSPEAEIQPSAAGAERERYVSFASPQQEEWFLKAT